MKENFKMISHKDMVSINVNFTITIYIWFLIVMLSYFFYFENQGKFFFNNGKIYEGECKEGKGNGIGN